MKWKIWIVISLLFLGINYFLFQLFLGLQNKQALKFVSVKITPTKIPCIVNIDQLEKIDQVINKLDADIVSYQAKIEKYKNYPEPSGFTMNYEEYKNYVISKEPRLGQDKYSSLLQEMYQKWLEEIDLIHKEELGKLNQSVNNRIYYPLQQLINRTEESKKSFFVIRNKIVNCMSITGDDLRQLIDFQNESRIEKKLPTITLPPSLQYLYVSPTP